MKKIFIFALTGLLVASCASDDFEGDNNALKTGNGEITFSMSTPNVTRALTGADAAAKLGDEFVVYGWKQSSTQVVFDNYTLKYSAGTANQTLSNTNGWEYVGYTTQPFAAGEAGVEQSIKYWDYSAEQYNFLAWRILSGSSAIVEGFKTGVSSSDTQYKDTALVFQAPSASDLAKIYIANQVTRLKTAGYKDTPVTFNFRNLSAKVRLGIYETVPGYSVKEVKFYSAADGSAEATPQLFVTSTSTVEIPTAGNVLVKYQKADNVAVAQTTAGASSKIFVNGTAFNYQTAAENKESGTFVGRTSKTATYPSADEDGYTYAFPHDALELNLKVDYTLVSIDGKGEEIKVTGATAVVPTQYGQWKANYAYTYLFKISDKTNGTTGGSGDPESLYPITFDACVEVAADGNSQETVTTLTTPTFTTYQNGVKVTANDEYTDGEIFVTLYDQSTGSGSTVIGDVELNPDATNGNVKLYSVVCTDNTPLTEANVANYAKNGIILTDRTGALKQVDKVTGVETTFTKKLVRFTAESSKVYVVEYTKDSHKYYKVIKVGTSSPTATYTLTASSSSSDFTTALNEIEEGGTFYVKVVEKVTDGTNNYEYAVTGAAGDFTSDTYNNYDVTETSTSGIYKFTAKAGTSGSPTIQIGSFPGTLNVTIKAYEFAANSVDVTADGTTQAEITLNLDGSAADVDAKTNFTITGTGLSIKNVADGVVTIQAEKTAESGTITYKNNDVVVATATVTVKHYSFTATNSIINVGSVEAAEKSTTLTLKLGTSNAGKDKDVTLSTTPASDVATLGAAKTDDNSQVTLTAGTTAGTATVKAPDDNSISIEVTNFTVEVTGSASPYTVTFKKDGTAVDATLTPSTGTLTNTAVGTYSWTGTIETGATIKYTYKGTTFTLYKMP